MRTCVLHALLCYVMVVVFPASMLAADSGAAMLYTSGTAWINGASVPKSSAVFTGDLIQTRSDSIANIKSVGSNLLVLPDSLVEYQGTAIKLEHGRLTISTSKGMATKVGGLKIAPTSDSWTEFEVSDTDGTVKIAARKGNLILADNKGTTTLAEGQETTRQETTEQGKNRQGGGAVPQAAGGILNSPYAVGIAGGVAAGLGLWAIGFNSDDPVSPVHP